MSIITIDDLFSENQLNGLHEIINNINITVLDKIEDSQLDQNGNGIDKTLGRRQICNISHYLPNDIKDMLIKIASDILDEPVSLDHALCATYSSKYGVPNLPPHFDGDKNDLIINFQLSSNTSWDLGLNLELYPIKDNSAVVFNGNTNIHWRPHKTFNNVDYVQMIFFRFYKINNRSDYSYLPIYQTDKVFTEIKNLREKFGAK